MKKTFESLMQKSDQQFQEITQLNESQQSGNNFTESIDNNKNHNINCYKEIIAVSHVL